MCLTCRALREFARIGFLRCAGRTLVSYEEKKKERHKKRRNEGTNGKLVFNFGVFVVFDLLSGLIVKYWCDPYNSFVVGGRWFLMRRKKKETTNQETPQLNEQTEGWFSSFQLAFSLFDVLSGLIVKYFCDP